MGSLPFQASARYQKDHQITTIEMIASKMLMLCLVALTMFSLSNGESKEDCYKQCAGWCNVEKEGVENAVGTKDFKQKFYGSDFFKYIFGDDPKHEDYKQVGSDACLNYCSTKGAPWC